MAQNAFSTALSAAISEHIKLSPTRQETLSWLTLLVMQQGTICLWRLAAHVSTLATTESVRRRFYRFFQHVRLDGAAVAQLIVSLLGLHGKPLELVIDRTNWEFGKVSINILMVSVIWKDMGVPLIWSLLPTCGNSNTATRVEVLDRLHKALGDLKISRLMGDREFVGDAWMSYLASCKIPFILRLRENQLVNRDGYVTSTIADIARNLGRGQMLIVRQWCRLGQDAASPKLRLIIMRLPTGELLALACTGKPKHALAAYRGRWRIETMFANMKTKGFNMEDTHITDRTKLATMLAVLALAVALAVKTGVAFVRLKPIPVKRHGRKAYSLFALGLHSLQKIFASAAPDQVIDFLHQLLSPKIPRKPLRSMTFVARV